MESIFYECLSLGLDAIVFTLCYKLYRIRSRDTKALQEAPYLSINSTLGSEVENNKNCIPYAVISGTVKASANALQSKHLPGVKGVIQELISKERKIVWSPILRTWSTEEEVIHRYKNFVPFTLIGSGGWLQSPVQVEIVDPLVAEELTLTHVHSAFTPHERSLKELIVGWFFEEQMTGIVEVENMLTENTVLLGAGLLVLEDGTLKLKPPPPSQAAFLLSPLPRDSLVKKLKGQAEFYRFISFNLAIVGLFILSCIMMKFYRARKIKLERKRLQQRRHENLSSHGPENSIRTDSESPTCVVCLTNPVEAIVLECGHACLCVSCSYSIGTRCPICREQIDRVVPVYLP